jgi:DNA repair exonuclease SbcCD ATPase subunit
MRLIRLKARNFRGIGDAGFEINLDNELVLFYGPNGYGKTSITEAIEWLFYGETKRRKHGEQYWATEYQNTYRNAHGGLPVHVEAEVRFENGETFRLARMMDGNASSEAGQTFVDDQEALFSSIGLTPNEASYPVVAQHGLQTFIHTRPKDRRDAIAAALGLDDLIAFRTALEGARRSYTNSPPRELVQVRQKVTDLGNELEQTDIAIDVAKKWQKGKADERDIDAIKAVAQRLTGCGAEDLNTLLDALRERRRDVGKSVFDPTRLSLRELPGRGIEEIEKAQQKVTGQLDTLAQTLDGLITKAASAYSTAYLKFWTEGLRLADGSTMCPMCEHDTLQPDRQDELRRRVSESQKALELDAGLRQAVQELSEALQTLEQATTEIGPAPPDPEEKTLLRSLFDPGSQKVEAFLHAYDQLHDARREMNQAGRAVQEMVDSLPARLGSTGADFAAIKEAYRGANSSLKDHLTTYLSALKSYYGAWAEFSPALDKRIATDLEIRRIDAVGKALKASNAARRIRVSDQALNSAGELLQRVEKTLQTSQRERLDSRGAEVRHLYDMLNPGAHVGFEKMEPGTNKLSLHANSFGQRMPAAPNLSQCQLNCLGLAVWLMRATTPTSPFGFIVLDDPVQSMDDEHYEALLSELIPCLLDQYGKQVIIFSHFQNLVERTRSLNPDRESRVYNIEQYRIDGPEIVEQAAIKQRLSSIKHLANGNQHNRDMAVDRLRVLVETFIRELYIQKCGGPTPTEYDRARARELLQLFRNIPGTTPEEHNRLSDTVGFADPAHHTDQKYTTPRKERIQPHISRLEQLMRTHGLL